MSLTRPAYVVHDSLARNTFIVTDNVVEMLEARIKLYRAALSMFNPVIGDISFWREKKSEILVFVRQCLSQY